MSESKNRQRQELATPKENQISAVNIVLKTGQEVNAFSILNKIELISQLESEDKYLFIPTGEPKDGTTREATIIVPKDMIVTAVFADAFQASSILRPSPELTKLI